MSLTILLLVLAFILTILRFFIADGRLTAGAVLALIVAQCLVSIKP